jgi:hypothetical protein
MLGPLPRLHRLVLSWLLGSLTSLLLVSALLGSAPLVG